MKKRIENRITINGESYPLLCNNYVLYAIQEEFGTISQFERALLGIRETGEKDADGNKLYIKKESSIEAINFGLVQMVKEGMEYERGLGGEVLPELSEEQIIRGTVMSFYAAAEIIHREFGRCFETKK